MILKVTAYLRPPCLLLKGTQQADQLQKQERAAERKSQVGTGDRSERIRTYNFPQGRVSDHRINLTIYKLNDILSGSLDIIINPLIADNETNKIAELNNE